MSAPVATESLVPVDVIDIMLEQHAQIRAAIGALATAVGPGDEAVPDQAVRELEALIEAHEDVEARLVHPLAEQGIPDGVAVAHARVVEENRADELLGQLVALGVADTRFPAVFAEFRDIMLDHLRREELEEFAALRAGFSAAHLVELGVRARENRLWL
jgi:hypothetical protein